MSRTDKQHQVRTLWLCGVLHAFNHMYHVALLPLYFPIQRDFGLGQLGQATFLVTAMMVSYFVPSYPLGVLADRLSRRKLLAAGLLINGLGFVGLGLAPNYPVALASVALAGFGGSFYHPAATAMIVRLHPVGTGRALGLVGMGASLGFFLGPIYTGWRAQATTWRAPIIELGALGIIAALLFAWLADEEPQPKPLPAGHARRDKVFPTPALWAWFLVACLALSLRDFAGTSMGTLSSLFLQQAHGFSLQATGMILSGLFIASLVSNPLFGRLSDSGRARWASFLLVTAALLVVVWPHLPRGWLFPGLLVYGFFFLATYPIVEASLMESVPDAVRGRVFGLFVAVSGLLGNLSHWLMGRWVEGLKHEATDPTRFYGLYNLIAGLIIVSLAGLPCLRALQKRERRLTQQTGAFMTSTQPGLELP